MRCSYGHCPIRTARPDDGVGPSLKNPASRNFRFPMAITSTTKRGIACSRTSRPSAPPNSTSPWPTRPSASRVFAFRQTTSHVGRGAGAGPCLSPGRQRAAARECLGVERFAVAKALWRRPCRPRQDHDARWPRAPDRGHPAAGLPSPWPVRFPRSACRFGRRPIAAASPEPSS